MNHLRLAERASKLAALPVGLALALGIAITPAAAQAEGWYAGAGFGQSKVDVDCDLDISCSADDTDTAWKLFGGYQFQRNFAVEFGYVDLGKATLSGTDSFLGTTSASFEATGFNVAAVGFLPVAERFALIGKAGFFRWDLDLRANSSVFGSGSTSETGVDFMFGLGASADVAKNFAVRVEWERFLNVGDKDTTGQSDIDLVSASLVFRF